MISLQPELNILRALFCTIVQFIYKLLMSFIFLQTLSKSNFSISNIGTVDEYLLLALKMTINNESVFFVMKL